MLQARLYRAAFLFAILAVVVMAFSVVSRPQPIQPEASLEPFDEVEAAADARGLIDAAPDRLPGTGDGAEATAYVAAAMESLEGGSVAEHSFEADFEGERVELTNVALTLSGETDERVVITAPRDCSEGPCAASSAASTGALLELARGFSRGHHHKTFEFVSTDGSVAGAAGAKHLAGELADRDVTAIITLSGAGVAEPRGRAVVPWSAGTRATSIQLLLSAEEAVRSELVDEDPLPRSTASELVRLAIPAGLGEQAPLVAQGYPAIGISGSGPRPLPRSDDEQFSVETLGAMGRTVLSLARALDSGPPELEQGPPSRIPLAGKLVPGWALALLSATLLIPIAVVAVDSVARAGRAKAPLIAGTLWLLARTAPLFGALLLAVLLGLVGVVPAPAFPFDPERHLLSVGPLVVLVLIAAVAVGGTIGAERVRARPNSEPAVTAVLTMAMLVAGIAIWIVNPYLALVLAPTIHIWLAAAAWGSRWSSIGRVVAVVVGFTFPAIALVFLGAQFGTGPLSVPWQTVLLFTGGHFTVVAAMPLALALAAALAAMEAPRAAWTDVRTPPSHGSRPRRPIRHPQHGWRLGHKR